MKCIGIGHCEWCQTHPEFKDGLGITVCPHGYTADKLPTFAVTRSRGLGDTLAAMFKWLGFKTCEACARRRDWLNWHVPYGRYSIRERLRRLTARRPTPKPCGGCGKHKRTAAVAAEGV